MRPRHDNMTEWWYYTGHMFDDDGNRYGFEFVFFQVQRGSFPSFYASHFAITDAGGISSPRPEIWLQRSGPVRSGLSFAVGRLGNAGRGRLGSNPSVDGGYSIDLRFGDGPRAGVA
ncbi:MAG: lipocalin-like domain-containing protein [Thermomicrobiales bacterium]